MNILAFDTCFGACSVAAGINMGRPDQQRFGRFEPMDQGHVARLLPMIDDVVAETGISLADFDLIGVTVGPGTFAGTRIGIAAAKGLALALNIPLLGLSSLAVIAAEARSNTSNEDDICVVIDVQRTELYAQVFDSSGTIARSQPSLLTFEQARDLSENSSITYIGSGANHVVPHRKADVDERLAASGPDVPNARFALDLLFDLRRSQNHYSSCEIRPLYLRAPDAKPPASRSVQRF